MNASGPLAKRFEQSCKAGETGVNDSGFQIPSDQDAIARFERLIAPLDHTAFADRHFGRGFLHQTGDAGRFADLVGWDDLNTLLTTQRLEPPRLILVRGGKPIPAERYLHSSGPNVRIDAGAMSALLAQGATMVLSFIDEMLPRIGAVADDVAAALMARATVNLYAGWRADHGFDLHWDHHDVIILQIAGRKHWRVHPPTRHHPLRGEAVDPPAADDEPAFDTVLEDGEMLYLPRGWWHIATPVDEPSLHLTIAITSLNGLDYLRWFCDRMAEDSATRRDLLYLADPSQRASHMDAIKQRLLAMWDASDPAQFHRERAAQLPARPRFQLPRFATATSNDGLTTSRLRLAGVRHLCIEQSDKADACHFEVNARRWDCSAPAGRALERLSSAHAIRFEDLASSLAEDEQPEFERLVLMLASVGVIFVES